MAACACGPAACGARNGSVLWSHHGGRLAGEAIHPLGFLFLFSHASRSTFCPDRPSATIGCSMPTILTTTAHCLLCHLIALCVRRLHATLLDGLAGMYLCGKGEEGAADKDKGALVSACDRLSIGSTATPYLSLNRPLATVSPAPFGPRRPRLSRLATSTLQPASDLHLLTAYTYQCG